MDGSAADHPQWSVDGSDDAFDAGALEEAMIEAREEAYQALASLDAA